MLVLTALVLVTLDYRGGEAGPVAAMQRVALALYGPLQGGFAAIVRPVGGFLSSIGQLGTLREQNEALQAEVEQLRQRDLSLADLMRENDELRAELAMPQREQFTTVGATVIGQDQSTFDWTVVVDVGAQDGVVEGMTVVNADGLVGRVVEVTPDLARVQLASSPESRFSVRIAGTGERAFLLGNGTQPFRLEIVDPEVAVPVDAEVVTTTYEGSQTPDGVLVGIVEGVTDPAGPPQRFRTVQPYVDFSRLSVVQVVLDAPDAASDGPVIEPVPGTQPQPPPPPVSTESIPPDLVSPSETPADAQSAVDAG